MAKDFFDASDDVKILGKLTDEGDKTERKFVVPVVNDNESPIVVFVGPAASGKSMILVRLAQYLRDKGYIISPDTTFVGTDEYQRDCALFKKKLSTNIALDGTLNYLLLSVSDHNGNKISQLLEAPGEDYFNPTEPEKQIPHYLNTIMSSQNRKTYVILLDLDSKFSLRNHKEERDMYAQRLISEIYPNINHQRDRVVFLYNKIDKTKFGNRNSVTNLKQARKDAELFYPALFSSFKKRLLGGLWELDDFVFMPFCTGIYTNQVDEIGNSFQTYIAADDSYPESLWNEIIRKW